MAKEFYRNEAGVVVSSSSICDGKGTTYQLRNVNSVRVFQQDIPWVGTIVKSLLWMMPALIVIPGFAAAMHPIAGAVAFLATLGGVGFKIYSAYKRPRTIYSLMLSTSNGEVDSFRSTERSDVEELSMAVSEALDSSSAAA